MQTGVKIVYVSKGVLDIFKSQLQPSAIRPNPAQIPLTKKQKKIRKKGKR